MCIGMFPMQVNSMDLAKLIKKNEQEIAGASVSDDEEAEIEIVKTVDLPPEIEMQQLRSNTGSAVSEKSPKSINDSSSDGADDVGDEEEQGKSESRHQKNGELGNRFFSFIRNLFK